MPTLEPIPQRPSTVIRRQTTLSRSTERNLSVIEHQALVRSARVRAEEWVASEKLRAVDHLAETAMLGQAMLAKWRDTLSGPDPLLNDELRFFSDVARMGKAEIIIDTIAAFRRQ